MGKVAHEDHLGAMIDKLVIRGTVLDETLPNTNVLNLDRFSKPELLEAILSLRRQKFDQVQLPTLFIHFRLQLLPCFSLDGLSHTGVATQMNAL